MFVSVWAVRLSSGTQAVAGSKCSPNRQFVETCYLGKICRPSVAICLHLAVIPCNINGPSTQVPLPLLQVQAKEEGESRGLFWLTLKRIWII
jgi:hypothetical protein